MNARFWIWHNGWVKLTLRPEQSVTIGRSWDNGEGWSHESSTFIHVGTKVREEWCNGGTDCDGRHERTGVRYCHIGFLRAVEPSEDGGPMRPDWIKSGRTMVYDQFAQAAGY